MVVILGILNLRNVRNGYYYLCRSITIPPTWIISIRTNMTAMTKNNIFKLWISASKLLRWVDNTILRLIEQCDVGNSLGIKTTAILSDMNHPIGYKIGNALEIVETLECLRGEGPVDIQELIEVEGKCLRWSSSYRFLFYINNANNKSYPQTRWIGARLELFNAITEGIIPESS